MKSFQFISVSPRDLLWGLSVMSTGYQDIAPGDAYPSREHPKEYVFNPSRGRVVYEFQLVYIISGKGTFKSAHCPEKNISAGNMFVLFPGEWHSYCPDPSTGWKEYWIAFTGFNMEERVRNGFLSIDDPVYDIGYNESVINMYRQALVVATQQRPFFQQVLCGAVNYILGQMIMSSADRQLRSGDGEAYDIIGRARAIMTDRLETDIDMPSVARELNISYSAFRHHFKKYTGLSPQQYFIDLRLHRAKELLRSSSLSIKEIAYRLNFESPEYFATFFRKRTGMRPSQFRDS